MDDVIANVSVTRALQMTSMTRGAAGRNERVECYLQPFSHLLDLVALLFGEKDLVHDTLLQWREICVDVFEVVPHVVTDQEVRWSAQTAHTNVSPEEIKRAANLSVSMS